MGRSVDIHQHLWPEPLLRALAAAPATRRCSCAAPAAGPCAWLGEPEAAVDLADHDPDKRAALADADGLACALVAPSIPLGIEALPAGEAEPLLAAYHDGVAALPAPFRAWAAVGLAAPDPTALAGLLDRGFAGACVAADALAGPAGYERLGPVLETLERARRPAADPPRAGAGRRRRPPRPGGRR